MTRPTLPPALRGTLYLRRRTLAALCAFAAVLAALLALAPPSAPTVTVLAAASALPGGTVLTSTDLVAVELPPGAVPDGAARVEADVVGRTLASAVGAGSVLTATAVSEGTRLARPGHVVIALPLADETIAALVRPGVRIDVLDAAGVALASDIPVVAPPGTPGGVNLGMTGPQRSVLVEVPHEVAATLTAQGMMSLTVALR